MDPYNPARDVTPAFLHRVATWLEATGEVLVVLRYLCAGGAKDFALCRTRREFASLVSLAPTGTDIEVFRDRQLPHRGVVDEAFIAFALGLICEGEEFLLVSLESRPDTRICRYGQIGDSHVELFDTLVDSLGDNVALGRCPNFLGPDDEGLISAAKDGIDGAR